MKETLSISYGRSTCILTSKKPTNINHICTTSTNGESTGFGTNTATTYSRPTPRYSSISSANMEVSSQAMQAELMSKNTRCSFKKLGFSTTS